MRLCSTDSSVLLVKEKQLTGARTAVPTGIAVKSARLSTGKAGTKMSAKNSPKSERNRTQKKKRKTRKRAERGGTS